MTIASFETRHLIYYCTFIGETKEERRKRKKSRWGSDEKDKSFILGMPTVLPTNLSKEQEAAYLCKYTELYEHAFIVNINLCTVCNVKKNC